MAANESRRELSGFDESALRRANLGTAFSDLVPTPLDREVARSWSSNWPDSSHLTEPRC